MLAEEANTELISPSTQPENNSCNLRAIRDLPLCPYDDLYVVKILNKAKFPVYLTCSRVNKQHYAMKMFPLDQDKPHRYFRNEIRFAFLEHPNVIKIVHIEHQKTIVNKGNMSYILMEYAPYGDFFDLLNKIKLKNDEKLIRTYFRQLIKGMEYLHSQGVAHMDLKLDNLLLGNDYLLKIADFDLSYMAGDKQTLSRGTKCYRAPEIIKARCNNFQAADIYSAGVILFIMKSGGIMPHFENNPVKGINFFELQYFCNERFWEEHKQFQENNFEELWTSEFKELYNMMTKYNPEDRASLQAIKRSAWYKGEVYTDQELYQIMKASLEY